MSQQKKSHFIFFTINGSIKTVILNENYKILFPLQKINLMTLAKI